MLDRYSSVRRQPRFARFHVDQQVTAHYFQARILWLQGYADQALHVVERNIEEGEALGHALSFGSVLGQGACPIEWFTGDLVAARRHGSMLHDHAEKCGLRLWGVWASCFLGLLTVREGDEGGLQMMRAAFEQAGASRFLPRFMILMGEFAAAIGAAGDAPSGLETVDGIIARCERSGERWYVPELLRIKGELLILQGAAAQAEELFLHAFDLADVQDAHAWQLRAAISPARLRRRPAEAREHLAGVLAGFSEGFATYDLRAAQELVAEL